MLKVSLENNPQVLFDLKIFVEGDRECIGSANLKGLSMKQILNMFNSLLATNEKIINELKPVIMGQFLIRRNEYEQKVYTRRWG